MKPQPPTNWGSACRIIIDHYPSVRPGSLTLDNFLEFIEAIKEKVWRQKIAAMSPEERMVEAAKREIDDMRSDLPEEELIDESPTHDDAGQSSLLQALGIGSSAGADRVQSDLLEKLASGYGR